MNKVQMPTVDEIQRLPLWAGAALAARCARRTLPRLASKLQAQHPRSADESEKVITACERAASVARSWAKPEELYQLLRPVMEVATTVEQQSETRDIFHFTVNTIWQAVDVLLGIEQINSARERAQASKDLDNDASVISAELYQAHALESALGTTVFALNPIVPEPTAQAAVRRDFDLLLAASEEFDWTDGTPVPPEFFGPLWPEGEPEGWPRPEPTDDHHSEPPVLKLEIAVPEGMDSAATQAFDAKVAELLAAMSAFDAAMGGHGLKILDECSNEPLRLDDESPIHEDNLVGVGGAI